MSGDTGALREQTDVFAVLENVDGGIDRLEVSHAAVDGDRTERAEDLCENGIFEKLFFGKEIDLALEIDADEEDVVHTDVVGADDASALGRLIFKTFRFQTKEKLIDGLENALQEAI